MHQICRRHVFGVDQGYFDLSRIGRAKVADNLESRAVFNIFRVDDGVGADRCAGFQAEFLPAGIFPFVNHQGICLFKAGKYVMDILFGNMF